MSKPRAKASAKVRRATETANTFNHLDAKRCRLEMVSNVLEQAPNSAEHPLAKVWVRHRMPTNFAGTEPQCSMASAPPDLKRKPAHEAIRIAPSVNRRRL